MRGVRFGKDLCIAVVSDTHGREPSKIIEMLKSNAPDYILMPGDIMEELDGEYGEDRKNGIELLRKASMIAPTFYSFGNHEDGGKRSWSAKWKKTVKKRVYDEKILDEIRNTGANLLINSFVLKDGIAFGGLASGLILEERRPELSWLSEFCRIDGPKILLCHHPEYYAEYLKDMPIDLIVSGHAHGGQWRIFGRGVFAPGQGLFPKYTHGVHDDRLVISTGLKTNMIPRFFNSPEIVFIHV